MTRVPGNVPHGKITAFTGFGWEYFKRRTAARTPSEMTKTHLWAGQTICEMTLRKGLGAARGVYTFNSAGLEILQAAQDRGMHAITEQTIVPRETEHRLLSEEQAAFPGWERTLADDECLARFIAREHEEWESAKIILCGSEFVRQGIADCGGPVDRCKVVHYGVDLDLSSQGRLQNKGPLSVLTVGAVGLRKGAPYILRAAKELKGHVNFRIVGSIGVLPEIERELREHVELTGAVPRSKVLEHYAWADVFLLPSLCEGSAIVTYEALACGLPVICTRNTGSVIRDGVEGYIIPIRDPDAISEKLELLASDRDLLRELSDNSLRRKHFCSLASYEGRLLNALFPEDAE
jgi:glycosyltransferase involved in cell wall biosynthesis